MYFWPALYENQFRRGLYTHWQQTYLHPPMIAFEAPLREECTAERSISNTPLQSLALPNGPTHGEAAKALAVRILRFGGSRTRVALARRARRAVSRKCRHEWLHGTHLELTGLLLTSPCHVQIPSPDPIVAVRPELRLETVLGTWCYQATRARRSRMLFPVGPVMIRSPSFSKKW